MPDMREKVKEYIIIEDKFVKLGNDAAKEVYSKSIEYARIESRIQTLGEVQKDLKNRLEEVI